MSSRSARGVTRSCWTSRSDSRARYAMSPRETSRKLLRAKISRAASMTAACCLGMSDKTVILKARAPKGS
ncbi:hypothetical protein D7X99_30095 [Corallococcus sp. AB032C]|nr:hypothetical protein D7X99_30095 [Corallococcus sp. AB032C]